MYDQSNYDEEHEDDDNNDVMAMKIIVMLIRQWKTDRKGNKEKAMNQTESSGQRNNRWFSGHRNPGSHNF